MEGKLQRPLRRLRQRPVAADAGSEEIAKAVDAAREAKAALPALCLDY